MHLAQAMYATLVALTLAVAGCASSPYGSTASGSAAASTVAYGTVESIEAVEGGSPGVGLGAVGGAVAGGLLGNQVGSGSGRAAATVGGAIAGGVAGHQIEKRVGNRDDAYRVRVRLDNGTVQVVNQDSAADLRVGGRVRIENGRAYPI